MNETTHRQRFWWEDLTKPEFVDSVNDMDDERLEGLAFEIEGRRTELRTEMELRAADPAALAEMARPMAVIAFRGRIVRLVRERRAAKAWEAGHAEREAAEKAANAAKDAAKAAEDERIRVSREEAQRRAAEKAAERAEVDRQKEAALDRAIAFADKGDAAAAIREIAGFMLIDIERKLRPGLSDAQQERLRRNRGTLVEATGAADAGDALGAVRAILGILLRHREADAPPP